MEFSEHIKTPKIEAVVLEEPGKLRIGGTACLTGHHLIFYCHDTTNSEKWFLHRNVDAVEKRFSPSKNVLVMKCKDFKQYYFIIPNQEEAINVSSSLEALSHVANSVYHFPFFYRANFKFTENGFNIFSTLDEFRNLSKFSDDWRMSDVNINFNVCESYPDRVIVPKSIDDQALLKSAQFRQGGRFPVLSYFHSNGRVLFRSSQPLVGPNNKRCKEDEKLVNAFLGINHRGYIFDTRTQQSAAQSRSKGGGIEIDFNYSQWKKIFHGMMKNSVQEESLVRMVDACLDTSSNSEKWQSKLESCNWLSIVKDGLAAACLVAQCIDKEGASVFVHGAEGLDSTLLVTSLTQVLLDPAYRTIYGMIRLIEKEWVHAGHPFMSRCLHSALTNQRMVAEGPAFTVFLDCVSQLQQQFPLSFEFNGKLLVQLHHHAYASEFGTFLCNNEKERKAIKLCENTVSLWSYILSPGMQPQFYNPVYRRQDGAIWPSVAPQSLSIWEGLFLPGVDSSQNVLDVVCDELSEIKQLEKELARLTSEVCGLEELLQNKK